jgi:hypothetical protein
MRRTLTALAAATAAFFMSASQAQATTLSGEGWAIGVDRPLYSLDSDYPYYIKFGSQQALEVLLPYALETAQHLRDATGLQFIVAAEVIDNQMHTCAEHPFHVFTLGYRYRPAGDHTRASIAYPCYRASDGSAWGGWLYMNSEMWTEQPFKYENPDSDESFRRNAVSHEVGHLTGLSHPPGDPYNCVPEGVEPIMCSPLGGYLHPDNAGKYTVYDRNGLQQLVANEEG